MKIIAHIDMNAFFASVEERDKPYLQGLPVVVGGDPDGGTGRGVAATANYVARSYGIHSGMSLKEAWKLSEAAREKGLPGVAFITPRFRKYAKASSDVFKVVARYGDAYEQTGVDEGYVDFSSLKTFEKAGAAAWRLRQEVLDSVGLASTIGIAENKMLAKLASERAKPTLFQKENQEEGHTQRVGLGFIRPEEVYEVLGPFAVGKLPGIGHKTEAKLRAKGIRTVKDLRAFSFEALESMFGTQGFSLYERARGIASADLKAPAKQKSIGKMRTFMEDTHDMKFAMKVLEDMAKNLFRKLKRDDWTGFKTVVLSVRFADFETHSRMVSTKEPMKTEKELYMKGVKLLLPFFDRTGNPKKKDIRLLGLTIERFS